MAQDGQPKVPRRGFQLIDNTFVLDVDFITCFGIHITDVLDVHHFGKGLNGVFGYDAEIIYINVGVAVLGFDVEVIKFVLFHNQQFSRYSIRSSSLPQVNSY